MIGPSTLWLPTRVFSSIASNLSQRNTEISLLQRYMASLWKQTLAVWQRHSLNGSLSDGWKTWGYMIYIKHGLVNVCPHLRF